MCRFLYSDHLMLDRNWHLHHGNNVFDYIIGSERARVPISDLSPEEKDRYNVDIRATNILLQGLPKDIYTLINHYTDAKDIWDNVKMLLEGSELTKEDRESLLNTSANKGETIHITISAKDSILTALSSPGTISKQPLSYAFLSSSSIFCLLELSLLGLSPSLFLLTPAFILRLSVHNFFLCSALVGGLFLWSSALFTAKNFF
ncbi:hypothetical protein Tco_0163551 [Tanacetum coccineum]